MNTNTRRLDTKRTIKENPTIITINRIEKQPVNGAFREVKSTVGPFTVRLYQTGNSNINTVSKTSGTKQTSKAWSLLADFDADIKSGLNITDQFDALGFHFKVVNVIPVMNGDEVISYQCSLERVD